MSNLRLFATAKSGNVTMMLALCLLPLMLMAGMAMDARLARSHKSHLQEAVDAAVLFAARNESTDVDAFFQSNLGVIANYSPTISVVKSNHGDRTVFTGTGNARAPALFGGLFGIADISLHVSSVASIGGGGAGCIWVVDPDTSQALILNGGVDVVAPNCTVNVASRANPAAIFNAGAKFESDRICLAGTNIIDNGSGIANIELNCEAATDPFAANVPQPDPGACDFTNLNFDGGTHTLSPGTYCGWVNFNAAPTIRFLPGLYVIQQGGWNVNGGNWSGDGVSFYFADTSKIQFNSGVAATLKAPRSGPQKGFILFEKKGLAESHFILDDSRDFELEGVIWLPSRNAIYNSGSQGRHRKMSMVFNTLILNQMDWQLEQDPISGISGSSDGSSLRLEQ